MSQTRYLTVQEITCTPSHCAHLVKNLVGRKIWNFDWVLGGMDPNKKPVVQTGSWGTDPNKKPVVQTWSWGIWTQTSSLKCRLGLRGYLPKEEACGADWVFGVWTQRRSLWCRLGLGGMDTKKKPVVQTRSWTQRRSLWCRLGLGGYGPKQEACGAD